MPRKKPRKKAWRFDLYPRNHSRELDAELFRSPTAEYRGAPFWSWNTRLIVPQLLRQIEQLKAMGFGGFHMHSRTGLASEYLGPEFMDAVRACTQKAASESMLAWLYDEDRWPSGFAGGLVTSDARLRAKRLRWTTHLDASAGELLAQYEIVLKDGRLGRYRRLKHQQRKGSSRVARGAQLWYACLETPPPTPWFNGQTYVDTLSPEAIERFIEVTHERYAATVGESFGTVVPAIFTDEPQFTKKMTFGRAGEERDLLLPFTTDFLQTYRAAFGGEDLLDRLPELFWDRADGRPPVTRYRYHEHTAARFAEAFAETIGRWCEQHGLALTGHMLGEAKLFSQTRGVGEVMRSLRWFHLPGIDILEDKMELTTAKQAQSAAHQYGRPGVMSELYGVTGWDFDFVGHKAQGDWQAALGVTVRVPHLAWVSMAGEAKRDYPASIGYQSPWYREYPLIEDHFARLNTMLTRGSPLVRVAVIHPLESYWPCFGPLEHNQPEMEQREHEFRELPRWLLFGGIDFDYVSEGLLPTQTGKGRTIGAMKYDAILVPNLRIMRATTRRRLAEFVAAGGTVIYAGNVPTLVDALSTSKVARPARLALRSKIVGMNRREILAALEPFREVEIRHHDGSPADSILHQLRVDGKKRHLFLCNTDRARPLEGTRIRVRGRWNVTRLDTMTGSTESIAAEIDGRDTIIPWSFEAHGHLLVTLSPGRASKIVGRVPAKPKPRWTDLAPLRDPVPVTLSEPNALLLDQAEWRLEGDATWQPLEEILRIDNLVRQRLGLDPRGGQIAQPWTDREAAPVLANLQLRFVIHSDVDVSHPQLAIEEAANVRIMLDNIAVPSTITGWWVDEAIHTVSLPHLARGRHELVLSIPFTRRTDVEWCYLLGDFGVAVAGRHARLTAPVRTLCWGDWTHQGLPFYAGNVTYHCELDAGQGGRGSRRAAAVEPAPARQEPRPPRAGAREILVEVPKFKAPILSVALDGAPAGKIAFAPFELELGALSPGRHRLDLTAFGNRANAFGPLHHTNEHLTWTGPAAWRSHGAAWAYEYQLKRMGVLAAPIVRVAE